MTLISRFKFESVLLTLLLHTKIGEEVRGDKDCFYIIKIYKYTDRETLTRVYDFYVHGDKS